MARMGIVSKETVVLLRQNDKQELGLSTEALIIEILPLLKV